MCLRLAAVASRILIRAREQQSNGNRGRVGGGLSPGATTNGGRMFFFVRGVAADD